MLYIEGLDMMDVINLLVEQEHSGAKFWWGRILDNIALSSHMHFITDSTSHRENRLHARLFQPQWTFLHINLY